MNTLAKLLSKASAISLALTQCFREDQPLPKTTDSLYFDLKEALHSAGLCQSIFIVGSKFYKVKIEISAEFF